MKTIAPRSTLLAAAALAFGTSLITSTLFAAAPDHRHTPGKAPSTTTVAPVETTTAVNAACTDARLVSVTETKFLHANGRGPTRTVELGQKLVCTACDTPMIVMKPSGHNARGAMAPVAIRGTHDCTKNGCTPVARVARID
jgi:hypothetical protein